MIYTAITAAKAAGTHLRKSFGDHVEINEAFAHDLKIQADKDNQDLIYSMIRKDFPDHRLIGEEGDSGNPDGDYEWIVDPIDGTMNFAMGIPHFCISIAARCKGEMSLGVIYDPMRDELFTTEKGRGSLLNGEPIRVSPRDQLSEAVLAIGFSKSKETIQRCLELISYYGPRCRKTRAMGSAALDLAYVAAGRLDAYIESSINLWDIAAGKLLVEEAGGVVDAKEIKPGKFKVVASSGHIEYPMS